ncbi:MAG: NADP-dependent malic enzyme [Candidatus Micrarchaeota archaeon]|nr:NADP-dependent malic enzyme [Candidatus Micrarchaeota archaeon]MDE1846834.1 NADP-dependent malic enzyme [Candidatus Micrarchaeota archaeon]
MVSKEEALAAHEKHKGKIEVFSKVPLQTQEELSTYYTPGVAYPCLEIKDNWLKSYDYTAKSNTIAIVTDGSRVLGLGDIGPEASLPVMEGKAVLFKKFGGVDAIPIAIRAKEEEEIVKLVQQIEPTFGGINIEDVESPKSFHIVEKLTKTMNIPIFHDDQQGTATVILAGLINAMKLTGKKLKECKVVVDGTGSAGVGAIRLLHSVGVRRIYSVDSKGAIYAGREGLNDVKEEVSHMVNPEKIHGDINDLIEGADVLIGLSGKNKFGRELISRMAEKPIVFALTNPIPEIGYEEGKAAGAYIMGTGSSDMPNQINNLLAFPGIMRGLLYTHARRVNQKILEAAAEAIAKSVGNKLSVDCIVPSLLDQKMAIKVASNVASAVSHAAIQTGVARVHVPATEVKKSTALAVKRVFRAEKKLR